MGKLISDVSEARSNVKRKEQSLPTKLVIRRLPPTLTEEELKQKLTFPSYDYFFFTGPNYSFGNDGFTRAYVNFIEYNDVLEFRNKFDGYIFYDNLGNEFSAVIEYAPCQQIPRTKQKVDQKINTFDKDPEYLQFLENLGKQVELLPSAEKYIEELQAMTITDKKREKIRTPLTDYLKEKRDSRIAARQLAVAQREKERKQRLEEKEKRREREKERKNKQEKERLDRKNLEKEKSDKKEYKKEKIKDGDDKKINDDSKANDVIKVENTTNKTEQFKSTEQLKTTEINRSSKSFENKKRYNERNDKYREKEDRRSYRNEGQDKYNNDQYETRKNRHSRDKDHEDNIPKERNNTKECERVEKPKEVAEVQDPTRVKKMPEQGKVEENELISDKTPSAINSEESKKGEVASSVKSTKKPRPEIKIYRPPSDRSAPIKSEKKDIDNVKGEKLKSNREKTRDNSRSTRYDKYDKSQGETRKKTERAVENDNRLSRDNKRDTSHETSTSHDRTADKILEKIKSDVNKSYDKISDKEEKTSKKTNAEIERDKELEQERYRMNWLVKQ